MIKYVAAVKTNVLSVDDVNITSIISRFDDESKGSSEKYSIFRKIGGLNNLTDANLERILASCFVSLELALMLKLESSDINDTNHVFAMIYNDDGKINVCIEIDDGIDAANDKFKNRLPENVNPASGVTLSVGYVSKQVDLSEMINKVFSFTIKSVPSGNISIRDGVKSFSEFNQKLYKCQLEVL